MIIKGGYFLRSVEVGASGLAIQGDLNDTASFEIITSEALSKSIKFNGKDLALEPTSYGTWNANLEPNLPEVTLPDLSSATWVSI